MVRTGGSQKRQPRTWKGRAKRLVNWASRPLPQRFRLKISYQDQNGPVPNYQRYLERLWNDSVQQTNLVPALGILLICVFVMLITLGPLKIEQPLQNLWVEFGGLTFDVFFILVVFALFEHKRQNRQDIERQKEIIADYKYWDSEEARFRIAGAIRRLNKRGIYAVDFAGAKLTDFSFSKSAVESIQASNFFDGVWGEFFKESQVELTRVDFSHVDCREVVFSPFDPLSGFGGDRMRHTRLTDCTFIRSNLEGASFNGAALKWTEAPPEDLYESFEMDDGYYAGTTQIAYGPFDEANLSGASFAYVAFANADFRNAEGILEADFTGATGLETAYFDTDEIRSAVLESVRAKSENANKQAGKGEGSS